ncbi:GyrI-like domain-containing protein [Psychromonas hadalis]|uniref:GyrI-like domain-containing protein n=1 Tax=Psychromonas hadalis TaxID=211669 RepID=UPI0003B6CFD0|nr:GyrI-like domain-containing protein [Psychromonas hadalis]
MKIKYSLISVLVITVFLSVVYYVMPRSLVTFEDMKPRLIELPEFEVTGFEIYGNLAKGDYPTAWIKVSNDKHQIEANCQGGFTYGIESYKKEIQTKWHYLAGCEMLIPSNLAETRKIKLTTRVIPKNLYVVFSYHGEITIPKIGSLYGYIFNEWLPKNGYQRGGFYNFERYDKRFLGAKDSRSEFELFVPIIKMPMR